MKKIKILCTLGPATLNKKFLKFAQFQKVDLVRLNMSHLSIVNLKKNINFIKENSRLNICLDTEGAQIRTKIKKKIFIKKNQKIRIFKNKNFHLYPSDVFQKLRVNDTLELGFNELIIKIIKRKINFFEAKCTRQGLLEANKGVHLVNRQIKLNFLTTKDYKAIELAKKFEIKNYALSFTNSVNDITKFKKLIPKANKIYKIETSKALKNFKLLKKKGTEFLIDRGDLSKDISIEKIPRAQRMLFEKKDKNNNIYIATNLLESMINASHPTRAEANDVYNSIEMGAAGLVLAAETAIGKHPEDCIIFLKKIISLSRQKKIKF